MAQIPILSLTPSGLLLCKGLKGLNVGFIVKISYLFRGRITPPQINRCIMIGMGGF